MPRNKPPTPPRRPVFQAGFRAAALCMILLALLSLAGLVACSHSEAGEAPQRVIVLGFDGLDYELTGKLMAEGRMPNFSRLAATGGGLHPLGTSIPPQSPVAWSTFITGLDSGGHGIYDFVHRDPKTMTPYLSTSRTHDPSRVLRLGGYCFPLAGGGVELLRHGTPFWEVLGEHGIKTTIIRMPADFPPSNTADRELSGMGTPDLKGTYGTFSFYTSELFFDPDVSGGEIYEAWPEDGVVQAELHGPPNPLVCDGEDVTLPFTVYVDPDDPVVKLVVGDEVRILKVGDWSDWVPVEFDLIPTQHLVGMARFYLKSLDPEFQLYVSPINFDPLAPAMPISHPAGYAKELARATGRFYTQGMPEDTQALKGEILNREDFLAQATLVRDEELKQYHYVLDHYDDGLLFYYIGSSDMVSHMLWDSLDPTHPAYNAQEDAPFADVIPSLYERLDAMLGYTLDHMPPETLVVVMSDHGFTSWKRTFHLNAWLLENGYLVLNDPDRVEGESLFTNVDWSRTRAYGLGINALYINLEGREKDGIVPPSQRAALVREIGDKLLAEVDPKTGRPSITRVYPRDETYHDRGHLDIGPDLIVGYAKGTRNSSDSAIGELAREVYSDNLTDWPGSHLMDHTTVPGILLTSRPLSRPAPNLQSLAPAILHELGVEDFPVRGDDGDGEP